jgi:RNA binding exosome subunit
MDKEQVKQIVKEMIIDEEIKFYINIDKDSFYDGLEVKIEVFIDGECKQTNEDSVYMRVD